MLDEETKSLLQIELNTISSSFAGFGSVVTELHRLWIYISSSMIITLFHLLCSCGFIFCFLFSFLVSLCLISDFFPTQLFLNVSVWLFFRYILSQHGKLLGLDAEKVPVNNAASQNAEGLAKAWIEYNNPKSDSRNKFSLQCTLFYFYFWFPIFLNAWIHTGLWLFLWFRLKSETCMISILFLQF